MSVESNNYSEWPKVSIWHSYCSIVYEGYSSGKEAVSAPGCSGIGGSVAPAGGEELRKCVSRVWEVSDCVCCLFAGSQGVLDVLEAGGILNITVLNHTSADRSAELNQYLLWQAMLSVASERTSSVGPFSMELKFLDSYFKAWEIIVTRNLKDSGLFEGKWNGLQL